MRTISRAVTSPRAPVLPELERGVDLLDARSRTQWPRTRTSGSFSRASSSRSRPDSGRPPSATSQSNDDRLVERRLVVELALLGRVHARAHATGVARAAAGPPRGQDHAEARLLERGRGAVRNSCAPRASSE